MPHTSVKGQILADLVAEFAKPVLEEMSTIQNMDGKSCLVQRKIWRME